jgi:hypothetical protein
MVVIHGIKMEELKLIKFIKKHNDWENILSNAPYHIQISHDRVFDRDLVLFKYDQTCSDFSIDIVKECRGIILDMTDGGIVPFSVPYFKFFNFGEPHAAHIDWNSAIITEKIDGSLIKIIKFNNELLFSTNGVIDAYKCSLPSHVNCPFNTFGELIAEAIDIEAKRHHIEGDSIEWFKSLLENNCTYMFELCSRFNRIVVPHEETRLYFHGWRHNYSLMEIPFVESDIVAYFKTPKIYAMKTLEDCIEAASELPWDEEGYVVVDKDFNRVKIKSPEYLKIHRLANNGSLSIRRAIDLYMENDYAEVLNYFPEYKPVFDDIDNKFEQTIENIENDYDKLLSMKLKTRKEQALWINKNSKYSGILFQMLDDYGLVREKLYKLYNRCHDSLIRLIGISL